MTRTTPTPTPTPTPAPPSPERARLAAALRDLKTRTGLSLAGLAARTSFSKSSWERYLNGRTLPPCPAVRELCHLAGEPEGRCLALWEIAESPAPEPGPSPGPGPGPVAEEDAGPGRGGTAVALAWVCAVVVVVGSVAATLLLLPGQSDASRSSTSSPPSTAFGPRCHEAACDGRNPMHMKCSVAPQTLASHRTATGARLELRHNTECGASWARMWATRVGDRLEITAGGRTHSAKVADDIDARAYVYTPMTAADSGTVVRACFLPAEGGGRECVEGRPESWR
ncbi:DUF2690 domain-containing protein [Streptomyces sp. DG2A-72]|uniref:helix-turn-helix domain-containing protein n=1 Tax=Streptomyces sp. DG2A-72 TaxID=3051386 RepID=UPI00265B7BB9|nr:XRE family transcriptional regulator [Streptomyces sp. DG2A-72]MDO0930782.1 DUF2690 domain-containing protein [Streptomyces sp. DG2A-72]